MLRLCNTRQWIIALALLTAPVYVFQGYAADPEMTLVLLLTEQAAVEAGLSRADVSGYTDGVLGLARSDVEFERLFSNPDISWGRENASGSPGAAVEDLLTVSQTLDLSGRRRLRIKAAEHRKQAAEHEMAGWQRALTGEIRKRFTTVLFAQHAVAAHELRLSRITRLTEYIRARRDAGEASGYDLRRMQREQFSAAARLEVTRADLFDARAGLAALLPDTLQFAPGGLEVTGERLPPEIAQNDTDPALLAARQPRLRSLDARTQGASLDLRSAGRWWAPDLTLMGGVISIEENNRRFNGLVLGGSLPLPFWNRRGYEVQRAAAEQSILQAERQRELSSYINRLQSLHNRVQTLRRTALEFRNGAMDSATRLVDIVESTYREGELGILELLDAYQQELDAALELQNLEFGACLAGIELDQLTGGIEP